MKETHKNLGKSWHTLFLTLHIKYIGARHCVRRRQMSRVFMYIAQYVPANIINPAAE